jgi:hypothetical protein
MKNTSLLLVLVFVTASAALQHSTQQRYWQTTKDETIWTGRYSNCDYGYYVLLPDDVVAHAELPPNPHHGFLISLPDVASRSEVNVDASNQYVWVSADYNATDASNLAEVAEYELDLSNRHRSDNNLVERTNVKLRSVPAVRFRVEYGPPDVRTVDEEVVALRQGILYHVGLRTPVAEYKSGRQRLEQVLANFRFSRIPKGECWNK